MRDEPNRIKLEDCEHRKLYRLVARNLAIGVFNKDKQEFIGIRTKFGNRFLDHEFHWDAPEYATCNPMDVIGELPAEIDAIIYYPGTQCFNCKDYVEFHRNDKTKEFGPGVWLHLNEIATECTDIRPCAINNEALFTWLKEQEKIYVPG